MYQTGLINGKEDDTCEEHGNIQEEWMILSDLHTPFENCEQTPESIHDWHQHRAQYSEQQIQEMPTWIKSKRIIILLLNSMKW